MAEPNTVNRQLVVPLTGDLVGAWGTSALNPNFSQLDGILGGAATISLSSATTFALTIGTGSITPSGGPNQSSNALLKFTGTLTGNAVIQFSQPGFYIVHNACTVGAFYVQLAPSAGTGSTIGAPPGKKQHVFFDGTSMDYVNMPDPGAAHDLHGATALPPWMTACSVLPYLIKDGSTYSSSVYPQLAAQLGSTFGGNGITTFGVPDERMGEVGKAFIILRPGATLGIEEFITWCRRNMTNYKVPRYVEFVAVLPTNASGKVLKFELRQTAISSPTRVE